MLQNFKTYELSRQLYEGCLAVKAPYHFKDQLDRAALSIVLNIAEGAARPTPKDRARFYSIAYASCREVQALIKLLKREDLWPLADQAGACLYRLSRPSH